MYPQSGTSSRPSRRGSGRSSSGSSTSRRFSKGKRRRERERRGEEDSRRQLRGREEAGGGGLPGGPPGDQLEGGTGEVRGAAQTRGPVSHCSFSPTHSFAIMRSIIFTIMGRETKRPIVEKVTASNTEGRLV